MVLANIVRKVLNSHFKAPSFLAHPQIFTQNRQINYSPFALSYLIDITECLIILKPAIYSR